MAPSLVETWLAAAAGLMLNSQTRVSTSPLEGTEMGLLSRLFGGRSKGSDQVPVLHIDGPGEFAFDVVGESHYQSALNKICGGRSEDGYSLDVEAALVHEDDNKYDPRPLSY